MKRVRRMLGIWDTGKVALGMLALLALWGVGELEQTEKAVTAVLWGGFLGLLSLSFLGAARRQRQYAACAPGRVVLRSWRGREQEITAGAVGEILFTGTCLRLLDLRGRRLGQIAWGQPPAADCWGQMRCWLCCILQGALPGTGRRFAFPKAPAFKFGPGPLRRQCWPPGWRSGSSCGPRGSFPKRAWRLGWACWGCCPPGRRGGF